MLYCMLCFFFKQKTAYEMRISDWSSYVCSSDLLSSWQALLDYLRADMAHMTVERVRVLHLNGRNMLIRDENMGDGSIDQAAIYEIVRASCRERVCQYV